jgi:hypothetical protein
MAGDVAGAEQIRSGRIDFVLSRWVFALAEVIKGI